jgi:hypothetical protein
MPHLDIALAYLITLEIRSPERLAVEALINKLIEAGTFTYADQHEYQRYIAPREDS